MLCKHPESSKVQSKRVNSWIMTTSFPLQAGIKLSLEAKFPIVRDTVFRTSLCEHLDSS